MGSARVCPADWRPAKREGDTMSARGHEMMKVVISELEVISEPHPWRGASSDNVIAVIMARKGLKLKPSVDPKPKDLMPYWRIETDPLLRHVTIWQEVE